MNIAQNDLDRNYAVRHKRSNDYSDSLDELVDMIVESRENELISEKEMDFLLNIALKKQLNKSVAETLFEFLPIKRRRSSEKQTMFMRLNSCHTQHV